MLLEIKVLHKDSTLIIVNTSRSRKTGNRAKKEADQESIWKKGPGLFYVLLDTRYAEITITNTIKLGIFFRVAVQQKKK